MVTKTATLCVVLILGSFEPDPCGPRLHLPPQIKTLRGSGGEPFWEGGDDFGVDVLRLHTCLTDILGFLEKLELWFEQDIDDEEEEDEEGEGGSELENVARRPPMLESGSYIPWASRFRRYLNRKRDNRKWLLKALDEGPYEFKNFVPEGSTIPRLQTAEDLEGDDLLLHDAEMEVMNTILLSIPNEIYNSVDACT
ncbi:hypothetical protein Tco_0529871 [Tanacetum coccineum]